MNRSGYERAEDEQSVTGGMFENPVESSSGSGGIGRVAAAGVVREAPVKKSYGRGPVAADVRKYRYDRWRGGSMPALSFGASKADRLDATEAGELLHKIHRVIGIDTEVENVLLAFDKALFLEHTLNGASLLQPGRGVLTVGDESAFELKPLKELLGISQRRFFRAFADDITDVNRQVIADYDPHDAVASEKYGQLMQVAVARGLQKYPHLAHDSSDAGVRLSVEERMALLNSKRVVLESTDNSVDKMPERARSDGA